MPRARRARALLLLFEKFTRAYLFRIALEIMLLPILITGPDPLPPSYERFVGAKAVKLCSYSIHMHIFHIASYAPQKVSINF